MSAGQQTLDSTTDHSLLHTDSNTPQPIVLYEMSQLLNTQLDKETLATCVAMIESGVNPEALAVRRLPSLAPAILLYLAYTHGPQTDELHAGGYRRAAPRSRRTKCPGDAERRCCRWPDVAAIAPADAHRALKGTPWGFSVALLPFFRFACPVLYLP
jgi:mitotic-spindle organizing protein 1